MNQARNSAPVVARREFAGGCRGATPLRARHPGSRSEAPAIRDPFRDLAGEGTAFHVGIGLQVYGMGPGSAPLRGLAGMTACKAGSLC